MIYPTSSTYDLPTSHIHIFRHMLAAAAGIARDDLARDVARLLRCEKRHDVRDVRTLRLMPKRTVQSPPRGGLWIQHIPPFRVDVAGGAGIHADAERCEIESQRAHHRIDRPL